AAEVELQRALAVHAHALDRDPERPVGRLREPRLELARDDAAVLDADAQDEVRPLLEADADRAAPDTALHRHGQLERAALEAARDRERVEGGALARAHARDVGGAHALGGALLEDAGHDAVDGAGRRRG